jgi:TetR/AcrR family transcriptional regulator
MIKQARRRDEGSLRARSGAQADARERILAAALSCFAERGFDGTTTRQIAAAAGVNLGLIQYYFGGKLELWRAAVDRAFAELRAGLEEVTKGPDPGDDRARIRLLIRRYVRFVAGHPEFIRLMHDEGKRTGPRMRWLVDRHVKPLYEATRTLIARGQARGLLPADIDPLHLHYVLVGAVGIIFHQAAECRRLTGRDPTDSDVVEAHADAVEALVLGARGEEDPA